MYQIYRPHCVRAIYCISPSCFAIGQYAGTSPPAREAIYRYTPVLWLIYLPQVERSAYIQSLARFTMLNVNSGFSEIRPKNLETIKTLISVAYSDCNYLEESWYDVSNVERYGTSTSLSENSNKDQTWSMEDSVHFGDNDLGNQIFTMLSSSDPESYKSVGTSTTNWNWG